MTVPKLRFKEFAGGWKSFSLLDLSSDKTLNNGVFNDQNKIGKGYKLINVLDMYIDRDIDESRLSLLDLSKQEFERNKVKYGDIFFTRSSLVKEGIAYSNVYLGNSNDITYDGHLIKLSPNLEQINSIFLNYGLKTSKVRKQLIQGGKTATMTTIGQKEIASTKIDVPFLEEQTKIASFLSSVDEKISQLTQKHQLLSQYKQGMMQKLFSQQIRFKADDGSEFDHWKKTKLDDLLIKHEEKADRNYQYPVLTSSRNGMFFQKDYFAGQDVASSDTTGYNVVPFGYFTYRHMSDDLVFKFNINTLCEKGIVSTLYPVFTVKETHLNKYFLQIILNEGNEFRNFAIMQKQGGSRTYMYYSKLKELILNIPTLPEQTKIANFLSALDQKINVVSDQLEQAKLWKKGLLQQMFV